MINTEVLGKAFEPEQYFEHPDGTPIQFDSDYFGNHRGVKVLPGPFAEECCAPLTAKKDSANSQFNTQ